jgi:hypothetical protein
MSFLKIARIGSLTTVLAMTCAISPAHAALLFSDNFDSDAAVTVLNFNSFNNWSVINGTVDYLKSYDGISCLAGGCVDLDGSTSQAGRMISYQSFVLDPVTVYSLSVTFSGSQRDGYGTDTIKWGITNAAGADWAYGYLDNIAASAPFNTLTSRFTGIGGSFYLFVEDTGSKDNVGTVLDSVSFQTVTPSVPEPSALLLFSLGIATLALAKRKCI